MHTIRSLHRGLRALEVLNIRKNLTVAEMAREIDLPRTTTFRILENLSFAGYLVRDEKSGRYGLTIRVRGLASGFDDDAWISEVARPLAVELGKIVVWPVSVMTPQNMQMLLRFTTDSDSPLAIDYYREGTMLPLLPTASGRVYLAYCGDREREIVLDALGKQLDDPVNELLKRPGAIAKIIEGVRGSGFALNIRSPRTREPGKTTTVAVPVMRNGRFLAALAMRYLDSAVTVSEMQKRYLPTLLEFAEKLEQEVKALL